MHHQKKFTSLLILLFSILLGNNAGTLQIHGRVMLDGQGLANVQIADSKTDSLGYYSFFISSEKDTLLTPFYKQFIFEPRSYFISADDTSRDSINFVAHRQIKKTIVIAGQSNTGFYGIPDYFIPDSVDEKIPYYLAFGNIEHGLNTLGPVSRFGVYSWDNFGIEILLARTLYKHYSDSLAIIKIGWGGTDLITNWSDSGSTWLWFLKRQESAELKMLNEGYKPEYVGFFWYQGESDRTPSAALLYQENLSAFVDRIRASFPNHSDVENLPFVCVRIRWNVSSTFEPIVRAAQMNIVKERPNTAWIDIDDCSSYRVSPENLHFNGIALNRIGYKLAVSYLDLIDQPIDSSISLKINLDKDPDKSVLLSVNGDTSFTNIVSSSSFTFSSTLGDSLYISIDPQDSSYEVKPANIIIPFTYHPSCLLTDAYTFEISKIQLSASMPIKNEFTSINIYPNPFNIMARININIKDESETEINLYDLKGRWIKKICGNYRQKGSYSIIYNASDLAAGLYVLSLKTNDKTISKKMLLLK